MFSKHYVSLFLLSTLIAPCFLYSGRTSSKKLPASGESLPTNQTRHQPRRRKKRHTKANETATAKKKIQEKTRYLYEAVFFKNKEIVKNILKKTKNKSIKSLLQYNNNKPILAVFSPTGNAVLTVSSNAVKLWENHLGMGWVNSYIFYKGKHEGKIIKAGFNQDGGRILTVSKDKENITAILWANDEDMVWDAKNLTDEDKNLLAMAKGLNTQDFFTPHYKGYFNTDGRKKIIFRRDGSAQVLKYNGPESWITSDFFNLSSENNSTNFSPNGKRALSLPSNGTVSLWNAGGTVIDFAVQEVLSEPMDDIHHNEALQIVQMLLDACDDISGCCSNYVLHSICHAASKVKEHNPQRYALSCEVFKRIAQKPGAPLNAQDAGGNTPRNWARKYGLHKIETLIQTAPRRRSRHS